MTTVDEQINTWYEGVVTGETPAQQLRIAGAVVAFAREHQVIPEVGPINLWGFGTGIQTFRCPNGDWWMDLLSISEATGIEPAELFALFDEERGGRHAKVVADADGEEVLYVVSSDFVIRVFAGHSPWRREFFENTRELMAHGMEKAGLFTPREGGPEFTAVVEMTTTDGEPLRLSLPVEEFGVGDVPMVRAPWDDADPDELVPVTSVSQTWTLERYGDSVREFMGPRVGEDEAVRRAFRGPGILGDG